MASTKNPNRVSKFQQLGKQEIIELWDGLPEIAHAQYGLSRLDTLALRSLKTQYGSPGSRETIEWVMGGLKPLLDFESDSTRLACPARNTREQQRRRRQDHKRQSDRIMEFLRPSLVTISRKSSCKAQEGRTRGSREDPKFNAHLKYEARQANTEPAYAIGIPDEEELRV